MKSTLTQELSIKVPTRSNKLLEHALENINSNLEVKTLWNILNVVAIERLGITDHGPVHFQIVANIALRLTRILRKHDIEMSITKHFGLSAHHAELVVLLASLFHDMGMAIDRINHEEYSIFMAQSLMKEVLSFLSVEERTIVIADTLHAIISHRKGGKPITIEAGIVRVADALDMSRGRSRIPYEQGKINIHSISAYAIENVEILEGEEKPIQINIKMNNSAGIFQVDELLKSKLAQSGIEQYVEVKAYTEGDTERKLLEKFHLTHV